MASEPLLRVRDLVKRYRSVTAVDGVSLEVYPGEIVGLVGPNGAGKTTVLRAISGIVRPTSGSVSVEGWDVVRGEFETKRRIALVPEAPEPYDLLTVREHLEFIARAYGTEDTLRRRGDELLARLSLSDRRDDLVLTLSKGMKQKLTVACAFVHDARLFLLDEPLMGMDPRGQRELLAMIREAASEGAGTLVSTHILATAEHVCDRIIVLGRGRMIAEGTLDQLRELVAMGSSSLEDVFLALTEAPEDAPP